MPENKPLILVVDDEKSNSFLLSKTLSKLDCEIHTASTGWEALELTSKKLYALVILDILMPGINGYETLVRIKSSKKNKETPVFLMTEMETDQSLLLKAYNAGAVDFIVKPVNLKILQRKGEYFLEFFQQKQALRLAQSQTENLLKSRMTLMANITHELRTPLFAMMGMVDSLKEKCQDPSQIEIIKRLEANSENLLDTINEFLDFSKLEAGDNKIENEFFSLTKLANDLISVMNYQYHKQDKVNIRFICDKSVPEFIKADKKKIRHILMNLFSNAVKFTKEGEITLEVRTIGVKEGRPYLKFIVEDTGVGIPAEKLDSIFKEYSQVDNDLQEVTSATGLGLSIVQRMVEALGGMLKVRSKVGVGSTFSFSIAVETANESDLVDVSDPYSFDELLGDIEVRILIVDDVPDNLFVLKNYLNVDNIKLSLAHDTEQALEYMENHCYDILFIDINMPGKNGFELVQQYRNICDKKGVGQGEVIMLSAFDYDDKIEKKLKEYHLSHYMMKPVKKGLLFEKIVSLAHGIDHEQDLKVANFTVSEIEKNDYDFSFLDQDFIDYLPRYLDLKNQEVSAIVKHLENNKIKEALSLCHKVLGTAESFGIYKVARDIAEVQRLLKENGNSNSDKALELSRNCEKHLNFLKENLFSIVKSA